MGTLRRRPFLARWHYSMEKGVRPPRRAAAWRSMIVRICFLVPSQYLPIAVVVWGVVGITRPVGFPSPKCRTPRDTVDNVNNPTELQYSPAASTKRMPSGMLIRL